MSEWYYGLAEAQKGPVSEEELKQLLEAGTLPPDTLVWKDGMADWRPASLVPDLAGLPRAVPADSPYAAPATFEGNPAFDPSGYQPSGSQVRPWIRYWARTLDMLLFGIGIGFVFAVVAPEQLDSIHDTLFGIGLTLVWVLVEPVLLSVFGTTPMKALFRIRVRNQDGSRPGYARALKRSFDVALRGLGLGIPLVSLITLITSNSRLSTHGITSWDSDGGFVVGHQPVDWWRWLIFAAILIGFFALVGIGASE